MLENHHSAAAWALFYSAGPEFNWLCNLEKDEVSYQKHHTSDGRGDGRASGRWGPPTGAAIMIKLSDCCSANLRVGSSQHKGQAGARLAAGERASAGP